MPTEEYPQVDWSQLAKEPDYELALPGGLVMLFRRIPRGSFLMGSRGYNLPEEPQHRVIMPQEFYLGKYVVTQAEYAGVVKNLPSLSGLDSDPSHFKGERRPVEQVSWDDAAAWLDGLRNWAGFSKEVVEFRLPTEPEWEYACRAGRDTEYYNGDGEAALSEVGWFDGNSESRTHDVDERVELHLAGLQGMHGNVWEWCGDVWDGNACRKRPNGWVSRTWDLADAGADATHYYEPLKLGEAPDRVLRGGSWIDFARLCRSAFRLRYGAVDRVDYVGFRVCLVRGPSPASQTEPGAGQDDRAEPAPTPEDGSRGTRLQSPGVAPGDAGNAFDVDLATAALPVGQRK